MHEFFLSMTNIQVAAVSLTDDNFLPFFSVTVWDLHYLMLIRRMGCRMYISSLHPKGGGLRDTWDCRAGWGRLCHWRRLWSQSCPKLGSSGWTLTPCLTQRPHPKKRAFSQAVPWTWGWSGRSPFANGTHCSFSISNPFQKEILVGAPSHLPVSLFGIFILCLFCFVFI